MKHFLLITLVLMAFNSVSFARAGTGGGGDTFNVFPITESELSLLLAAGGTGGGGGTLGVRNDIAVETPQQLVNTRYGEITLIGATANGEIVFQLGNQTYSAFPEELAEEIPELTNL